jgi:2-polyprenyl-6-methoxyphenol hydroxylase-like FAD-dependent oxidoreductase
MSTATADRPPVLIVGAGPTGLTLALLLARMGVRSTLFERDPLPQQHPAACILNTRTMEVFRIIGVEPLIRGSCQDMLKTGHISWVVSLAGRELGRRSAAPDNVAEALAASPTQAVHFPQHKLEPMLWELVRGQPLIEFLPGWRCEQIEQSATDVTATIVEVDSGRSRRVCGEYLIGCDGASSHVRRSLGIGLTGAVLQYMLGLHFLADLGRFVDGRESLLYWLLNRDVVGVMIGHWLPTDWVLNVPYFPPQERPEDFTPDRCREIIYAAIGTRNLPDLDLKNVGPWVMAARMADRFRLGRIFLAGDAAHQLPPTGGLGLNTGVQDVHNLAWKLAHVVKGFADPRLLDTYEIERRPIAQQNIDLSVRNYDTLNAINQIAGVNFRRRWLLELVQNNIAFRLLPSGWQKWFIRTAVDFNLRNYLRLDNPGPRGERLRAEVAKKLPQGSEHYRLGADLGFAYGAGAIASEQTPQPLAPDPIRDYRPTTWPGARLPHVWVERDGVRLALHDVLPDDGYLLLTQVEGRAAWSAATASVSERYVVRIDCLSIGIESGADLIDAEGRWRALSEVSPRGAVLVRPDGHVAWRSAELPADPSTGLLDVFRRLPLARAAGAVTSQP